MIIINASLKFKHVSDNTVKLVEKLVCNQDILRMIYYMTDDPLSLQTYDRNMHLVNQPNIESSLIGSHIILTPFDKNILTNAEMRVFFNPLSGSMQQDPISADKYVLDLVCNNEYWVLEGQGKLRCFEIANLVAQDIDGVNVAGIGDVKILNWQVSKVNDEYSVLSIFIKVDNGTIEG